MATTGTDGPTWARTRRQERAFPVGVVLHHHGPVEGQEDPVDPAQPADQVAGDGVEGLPGQRPRGDAVGGHGGDHLDARRAQDVQEAPDLHPGAPQPGRDLLVPEELVALEVGEVGPLEDEGVGLLHELADGDPHGPSPF